MRPVVIRYAFDILKEKEPDCTPIRLLSAPAPMPVTAKLGSQQRYRPTICPKVRFYEIRPRRRERIPLKPSIRN
jgi:hypothetical protein